VGQFFTPITTAQTRTTDAANEITSINSDTSQTAYDANGNMTFDGTLPHQHHFEREGMSPSKKPSVEAGCFAHRSL
jgi:hypothetical protein